MNFIKQKHKHGCGVACIAMATEKQYDEIVTLIPPTINDFEKSGITPECVQSILNELNYRNELRYWTILHSQTKREDLRYSFADILIIQRGNHFVLSICDWVYDPNLSFTDSYSIFEINKTEIISVIGVWNRSLKSKARVAQAKKLWINAEK